MTWWQRLRRQSQMESELSKELRFHTEQYVADLMARGRSEQEARRLARLELGSRDQAMEECRDARGTRWLQDLWQDTRYALRTLRQRPGFAAVALLTLALGTGATTVMFTVIQGVILKPLPFRDPARLVVVRGYTSQFGIQNFAYPDYRDCRAAAATVTLAGWMFNSATVTGSGDPEHVELREVAADLFPFLGVMHIRGRGFLPEEDQIGAMPVAMLNDAYWRRKFAASDRVLGSPIEIDGKSYTVIGITPPGFQLEEDDIYTLIGQDRAGYLQNRRAHPVQVWGRLKPGVTLPQAESELIAMGQHFAEQYPQSNKGRSFRVLPLRPDVQDVASTLWLLLGAVCLVLLIACVNVASLLLARAVARERELAMRVALGAGRMRLVRQCLTESAVLAIGGGVLGVALAAIGIRPFVAFWPGVLPRAEEIQLDWRVLLFTLGASLLCGLLFGLAPALRAPARHLEQTLRAGSRSVHGGSRRLHGAFVVSEVALAMVLLVSAGALGRTLLRLSKLNTGVRLDNVLVTRMGLSPAVLTNPARTRAVWQNVLDQARQIPGVESAALVDTVPMRAGNNQLGYWTSATPPASGHLPMALATSVTPDYFKVMGIALRSGREFTDDDRMGSQPVVVIDDVLAQNAFGHEDPVGKRLWIPDMGVDPFVVAGVVAHVRHWGLASDDQATVRAQFYYPWAQVADPLVRRWSELMSIVVHTTVPPLSLLPELRHDLRGLSGDQVLYQPRTMEQLAHETLGRQRFLLLLFAIFAALAMVLATIGIYGVMAYLTSQRVPEFGVRIALGATARDVIRLVLLDSVGMLAIGIALGVGGAIAAGRVLSKLVDGVESTGAPTIAVMVAILFGAALAASLVPARRAARTDPIRTLRD